jgi:hypothetical protein
MSSFLDSLRLWIYPNVPASRKFTAVETLGLRTAKETVAEEILDEAKDLSKIPFERADAAERRATTLQGAVAIAASFSLAAGTLVAGADKIGSHAWRIVFAAVFGLVVTAFVLAGVLALQVTSRIGYWKYPDDEGRLRERARLDVEQARVERIIDLLQTYGENDALARWKVSRATWAARVFRVALLLVLLLAGLFVGYVAATGGTAGHTTTVTTTR